MSRRLRCPCVQCVAAGSTTLLSYYLRRKHAEIYGLASEARNSALEGSEPEEALEVPHLPRDEDLSRDEGLSLGSESSLSTVPSAGGTLSDELLEWYRQSRGLPVTRRRMDALLGILQHFTLTEDLPRQVRTLEKRRQERDALEFTAKNLVRTIVCGACNFEELTVPESQCQYFVWFVAFADL